MDLLQNITNQVIFVNKDLNKATNEIFKLGETIKNNLYNVAYIMAAVETTECFKDDGFNNVHEWAMKTFGFKKSASYTLLKIGKEYTREIKNPKNGKISGYASNLIYDGDDFTTTQIEKMLPLGHKVALELVDTGIIKPEMSCREIGTIVKEYLNPVEEVEVEETAVEETKVEIVHTITISLNNDVFMYEMDGTVVDKETIIDMLENIQ